MARFGIDQTEVSPTPSHTTVLPGVERKAVGLRALTSIFDQVDGALSSLGEAKGQRALSAFADQQLAVIQAVDQGVAGYSSHFGRTKMRENLRQMLNSHPSLRDDILTLNSTLLGQAGMGEIITAGTRDENLKFEQRKRLVESGIIDPDAGEAEIEQAEKLFVTAAESKRRYDAEIQTLELRKKQGEAVDDEIGRLTRDVVSDLAPAALRNFESQVNIWMADDALAPSDRTRMIEQAWSQMEQEFAQYIPHLDESVATSYRRLFEQQKEIAVKRATSAYTDQEAEAALKRADTNAKLQWMKDPDFAKLYGLSSLMQNSTLSIEQSSQRKLNEIVLKNWDEEVTEGANPLVKTATEKKAWNELFKIMENSDPSDPVQQQEVDMHISTMIDEIAKSEGRLSSDPELGINMIKMMSKPFFFEALQRNPDARDKLRAAVPIITEHYADEVYRMVQDEFERSQVLVRTGPDATKDMALLDTAGIIGARSSDQGVEFYLLNPDDKKHVDVRSRLKVLNGQVAPILNETIAAMSHLNGSTNYKATADQVFEQVFGAGADTEEKGSAGEDQLELADFRAFTPLIEEAEGLQAAIDKTESGGSYDTLLGHQDKGGLFANTNVSEMSVGEAIEFSSSGGAYAEYSKGAVGRMATPMGRYQIVGATLRATAKEMGLDPDTPFDAATQDAMFQHLANKALAGKSTPSSKRAALRGVWEGFKHLSDAKLDQAIAQYEGRA